jgi:hypothetical protein
MRQKRAKKNQVQGIQLHRPVIAHNAEKRKRVRAMVEKIFTLQLNTSLRWKNCDVARRIMLVLFE